ncbi:MAG: DNA polymerase III subunit beta [Candidatus Liptonbacteria bacterium]|nr:DNA polymerase III subunit beta [Candidatus Liptonbacteria bacterium]
MKLIVLKNKLKTGLMNVGRVSGESASLPILKHILIRAGNGRIVLHSTNLEMGVQYVIPGKVIEDGAVTIDSSMFSSLISALPTERVHLERDEDHLLVKTDNYEAKLLGLKPEDFPLFPDIQQDRQRIVFKNGVLPRVLSRVLSAAQHSDLRPELSGVLLHITPDEIVCAATDSFRLAEHAVPNDSFTTDHASEARVGIPLKAASEIVRITTGTEDIAVDVDNNQIQFSSDDFRLISRRLEGTFPEYKHIIPQSVDTEILIDRKALMDGLRLAGIFTGAVYEVRIRVLDNKKAIEVSSESQGLGANTYVVPAKVTGAVAATTFNWKYLADGLRAFESDAIVFGLNGSDRPAVLKSPDVERYVYIVMPVRQ